MRRQRPFCISSAETRTNAKRLQPRETVLEPQRTFATAVLKRQFRRISPLLRGLRWSGRVDLNHRPPGPEPGALTGLRHAPQISRIHLLHRERAAPRDHGAPGGTRIPNLLIRSQMLYPIELQAPEQAVFNHNGGHVSVAETLPPSSRKTSPAPVHRQATAVANRSPEMGGTRLELVTSTMSTWRSNQLS